MNKYIKQNNSVSINKKWPQLFLLGGLLLLFLVLLYRLLFYASFLEVVGTSFSDMGGSTTIRVETDAVFVSLQNSNGDWYAVTKTGKISL